jgi:hypothetical protein
VFVGTRGSAVEALESQVPGTSWFVLECSQEKVRGGLRGLQSLPNRGTVPPTHPNPPSLAASICGCSHTCTESGHRLRCCGALSLPASSSLLAPSPPHTHRPLCTGRTRQLVRERSLAASLSLCFKLRSTVHWLEWPALSDVFLQLLRVSSQGIRSPGVPTHTSPQWRQCLVAVEPAAFTLAVHITRRFTVVRAGRSVGPTHIPRAGLVQFAPTSFHLPRMCRCLPCWRTCVGTRVLLRCGDS